MTASDPEAEWIAGLSEGLQQGTFLKLVLSRPRSAANPEPPPAQIRVRPIVLREQPALSFVRRYPTRDDTRNLPPDEGLRCITALLNTPFRSAHLFLEHETLQLDYSKKGRPMLRRSATAPQAAPQTALPASHDRTKQYPIDSAAPWLHPMGVTGADHQVLPSMSRKWKQINKFAEIIRPPLERLAGSSRPVHVVDFGCGRGLLTFALYDQLRKYAGPEVRVTGVELRPALVHEANRVAKALRYDGLNFSAGDIRHFSADTPLNGIVALHACDTATDLAIFSGIADKADFILCAPCCHKEIRPQIRTPPVLSPILRFGIQLGQEAEMITDSLRVLLLESQGYDTKLFEFISLEHTAKNKMILAVRAATPAEKKDTALQHIKELKAFYGIQSQSLESLLREAGRI